MRPVDTKRKSPMAVRIEGPEDQAVRSLAAVETESSTYPHVIYLSQGRYEYVRVRSSMPRVEFEADTEEELLAIAWRWVMGPQRQPGGEVVGDAGDQADLQRRQLGEVLNAIRGADSRRFVREVAELSARGRAL